MSTTKLLVTLEGIPYALNVEMKNRAFILTEVTEGCAKSFRAEARSKGYKSDLPKLKHLEVHIFFGKEQKIRIGSKFEVAIKASAHNERISLLSGIVSRIDFQEGTI